MHLEDNDGQSRSKNITQIYIVCKKTTLKIEGWRKICHANFNQKKARIAVLISDRGDFKARKFIRANEEHNKITKGWILQEDAILHMYLPKKKASKSMRQNWYNWNEK